MRTSMMLMIVLPAAISVSASIPSLMPVGTAVAATASTAHAPAATVLLRGGAESINATSLTFESGGARVTRATGGEALIPWDHVRGIVGMTLNASQAAQLAVAEDLWRARTRVQRGDIAMARPLFEKHFPAYRGLTSETALIVAEGTLRCRLASDDTLSAIVPAIETARIRSAGVSTDRYAALPAVLDDATLLCPALAPTWPVTPSTIAVAAELDALPAGDATVARIAQLTSAMLRGVPPAPTAKRDEGAVALLASMAALAAADAAGTSSADQASTEARTKLRANVLNATKGLPPWTAAWAALAVGRSLCADADQGRQIEGVLTLLRVPTLGTSVPESLQRSALATAIQTLKAIGDTESATTLEREFAALGGKTIKSAATLPATKTGAGGSDVAAP